MHINFGCHYKPVTECHPDHKDRKWCLFQSLHTMETGHKSNRFFSYIFGLGHYLVNQLVNQFNVDFYFKLIKSFKIYHHDVELINAGVPLGPACR